MIPELAENIIERYGSFSLTMEQAAEVAGISVGLAYDLAAEDRFPVFCATRSTAKRERLMVYVPALVQWMLEGGTRRYDRAADPQSGTPATPRWRGWKASSPPSYLPRKYSLGMPRSVRCCGDDCPANRAIFGGVVMLRLSGGQVESLFALGLPVAVAEMPADLAALDGLLAGPGVLAPIEASWDDGRAVRSGVRRWRWTASCG